MTLTYIYLIINPMNILLKSNLCKNFMHLRPNGAELIMQNTEVLSNDNILDL